MTAAFPPFAGVNHPSFRVDWLLTALDRLLAAEPSIDRVSIDLWVNSVHDDQSNVQHHGHAGFHGTTGNEYIQEELLDGLPGVRTIERRAGELWNSVPLTYCDSDGDASLNGEYSFIIRRGNIRFEHQDYSGMEQRYVLDCSHDGRSWVATETLIVPRYEGAASDLLADGHSAAIAAYEPSELGLRELPKTISAGLDEDGSAVFALEPGELMRCMGERE